MNARALPQTGERLYKPGTFVRLSEEGGKRSMRFVASDESVDRYGDIIRASGWQLDNFRKNPVLLFAHDSRSPAIGGVPNIAVEGTQLMADVELDDNPDNVTANVVWGLLQQGYMRATSVGFAPTGKINSLVDEGGHWTGYEFTSQELLELSVVPVPANPQALAVARSLGLTDPAARRLFVDESRALARAADAHRRRVIEHLQLSGGPR
jgi:HK97 family phage prohead protease